MAEESRPWAGVTVGDAGTYTDDDWDDIWEALYGSGLAPYTDRGVIRNWTNELEVTDGGANLADVDLGAALVHGKFYNHTAPVINLAIPSSAGAWREDLVCLQSDWVTQTIRIARHANPADGVAYPAPTQTDGVTWEIPLAAVRINAAGAITLITDLRAFVVDLMRYTREIRAVPRLTDASPAARSSITNHFMVLLTAGEDCWFELSVPPDFKEFVDAYVYVNAAVNCTLDWQINTSWAGCDEVANLHTDVDSGSGLALIQDEFECIDVSAAFDASPLMPGDLIGAKFRQVARAPGGDIRVFILLWRYR